jgi:glutamyl-tRNA(Gln) amidotransferase subunit E
LSGTAEIRRLLNAAKDDAQIVLWGPPEDIDTAIETIEERCLMAFEGVPNETRKGLPDGTTIFERVLPGPDRMYPDTDSAPIPIEDEHIETIRTQVPVAVDVRVRQLREWDIPEDTYPYLLSRNLPPTIDRIVSECSLPPRFVGTLFGHTLKMLDGRQSRASGFSYNKVYGLTKFVIDRGLDKDILKAMLPVLYEHPNMVFESVLTTIGFSPATEDEILSYLPALKTKFRDLCTSSDPNACTDWIMGQLRKHALGNMPLRELRTLVEREVNHE